jgi:uncharacterized cupin superfamily protein
MDRFLPLDGLSQNRLRSSMKIVKTNELSWGDPAIDRAPFFQHRKELGRGKSLACGLWQLPPGKKSFPFHLHHVTEEALFVISGAGKVRTAEGLLAIGPGDFVQFEPGKDAHQLVNDGQEPLVYVGVSAGQGMEIVEYPDSNKVSSMVGAYPDVKRFNFKQDAQVDYFEGEPTE